MNEHCNHEHVKKHGRNRNGTQRIRCLDCGATLTVEQPVAKASPLGDMRLDVEEAKHALHLLTQGMSIRATERTTGIHRDTLCKLMVFFGDACRDFLDQRMRGLTLDHLQFDEQWTYVAKKQSRLPVDDRREVNDMGDIYLWTCIDQYTKLMPSFAIGKRTADNARRFMRDVASRLVFPKPGSADNHAYRQGAFPIIVQVRPMVSRATRKRLTWLSAPSSSTASSSKSTATPRWITRRRKWSERSG